MILHADVDDGTVWMSVPVEAPNEEILQFLREEGAAWAVEQVRDFQCRSRRSFIRCRGRDCPLVFAAGAEQLEFDGSLFRITAPSYTEAERVFRAWWSEQALICCSGFVDYWMPLFETLDITRPAVRVRPLKRAWGMCYYRPSRIHFAERLYGAPDRLIEYVVLHELTHLIYPNHGSDFQAFLSKWMPDWQERKVVLRREAELLSPLWPSAPSS